MAESPWVPVCYYCGKIPYRQSRRPAGAENPLTDPPSPPGRYHWGGRYRKHDWRRIAPLLGKRPDRELAKLIGTTRQKVLAERHDLGIPRYRWFRGFEDMLGRLPDVEIARRAGVNPDTVSALRRSRGIPRVSQRQVTAANKLRDYLAEMDRLFNV